MALQNTLSEKDLKHHIELTNTHYDPDRFWMSVSKQKCLKSCRLKFKLRYIDKIEGKPKPHIAKVGICIHDSFDEIYKDGIKDFWFDMSQEQLEDHFYDSHRAFIEKHKEFPHWDVIFENNVRNLAAYETNRFFTFLNGNPAVPKDKMKDYFLPVLAEEFMKSGYYYYNYIPDAVFRIYETGIPEQDNNLLMFDLKAGSAQPAGVRTDDKGQVYSYSVFWNKVIEDYKEDCKNNGKKSDTLLNQESLKEIAEKYKWLASQNPNDETLAKKAKKYDYLYKEVHRSNERIAEVGGIITHWAILYLGNNLFTLEDGKLPEIKKRGLTAAHKRFTKYKNIVEENDWFDSWGGGWSCEFSWFDKITGESMTAQCDYHQYCFERQNPDLFDGLEQT